jgi:transcriptional regulator with XRE-family HTH domain
MDITSQSLYDLLHLETEYNVPRPNPTRDIAVEADLSRRIAWERENRGWTYDGLARRMKAAGCPMQSSAVYRIEKGEPPRRITVNELVAFSRVFEVSMVDLLHSPDSLADLDLGRTVRQTEVALREINAAVAATEDLTFENPQRQYILKLLLREFFSDWPEMRTLFRWALRGERHHRDEPQPREGV